MKSTHELLLPFPAPRDRLKPLSAVRSSLLSSSLQSLRDHGVVDRYFELLPAERHEAMLSLVAGVWVPVEVAIAHYETCDRLALPPAAAAAISADVANRIHGSVLATVIRMARNTGVTLWTGLAQFNRLYDRVFQGGGSAVWKLGPKEARIDIVEFELARIGYFRRGFGATIRASLELFSKTVFVRESGSHASPTSVSYRVSWV